MAQTGRKPGWDIEYEARGCRIAVEVKGTTGAAFPNVEVTANADMLWVFKDWVVCTSTLGTQDQVCKVTMPAADKVVTATFITVEQAIDDLIQDVEDLDDDLKQGPKNSLKRKLQNAKKALNKGNVVDAVQKIDDFINEVMAQSGKKISVSDADDLIAAANAILDAIL